MAADGAAVLVVGRDAAAVGRLVGALGAMGVRTSGFVGDGPAGSPEVLEMAAELFPGLELTICPA